MPHDPSPAERNLLFGLLALQNNLVDRAGLLDGFNRWVEDKSRPIGDVLVDRGAMRADERAMLEALVAIHLRKFGDDPARSLEALSSVGSARDDLSRIADVELQAGLSRVASAPGDRDGDPFRTMATGSVGDSTSAGIRFRILRPHAKGGLGQVSVAIDQELDRSVALKEIQDRRADEPESRARFVQEGQITGKLEHPGIVPVYGLGHDATGRPFYAMRFIQGDSLEGAVKAFHRDEGLKKDAAARMARLRELLRRFTDVCNAIAYAHSRGVLHRDLKPGNIMLGPYGETLVVDWGLAKLMGTALSGEPSTVDGPVRLSGPGASSVEEAGKPIGTLAFASPEQLIGALDRLGPATDIYGLGATLYSLLIGRLPVGGDDRFELLRRVEHGEIPPARSIDPTIPRPLEAICRKAMALRPEDRYESARALAVDVTRWLDDEPVSAYPEPILTRARRWVRNHRTATASAFSAAVVLVAAMGIAGWVAWRADRVEQERSVDLALRLLSADPDAIPAMVEGIGPRFDRVAAILASRWQAPDLDAESKLRLALALGGSRPDIGPYLGDRALDSDPRTVRIVADRLRGMGPSGATRRFWGLVEDPTTPEARRFRAACALAILDPPLGDEGRARWARHVDRVVRAAMDAAPAHGADIDRMLSPLEGLYLRAVGRCCREGDPSRSSAFAMLRLHRDRAGGPRGFFDQARPAALILDADPGAFGWLLDAMEADRARAIVELTTAARDPDALFPDEPSMRGHQTDRRRARALAAMARMGRADPLGPALRRAEVPDLRTWLVRELPRSGVDPAAIADRLANEADPGARTGLVLVLGGYDRAALDPSRRDRLRAAMLATYRDDPDPGVHGAVGWLLRARWGLGDEVAAIDRQASARDPSGDRGWFVNRQGQVFSILRGPSRFRMGEDVPGPAAPGDSEARTAGPHRRAIPRSFAFATTEVTVAQYRDFLEAIKKYIPGEPPFYTRVSPTSDSPRHGVQWFEALLYCRWLSEREGIEEGRMCFPPIPEMLQSLAMGKLDLGPGRIGATGYRLPSEAEWEYACRAGTSTPWSFGRAGELLADYGHFLGSSGLANASEGEVRGRTNPVGRLRPNDFGLFDMHGNVREWCLDAFKPYPAGAEVEDTAFQDPATAGDWLRAIRGGSFADPANWARSAYRNGEQADQRKLTMGFRVARTVPQAEVGRAGKPDLNERPPSRLGPESRRVGQVHPANPASAGPSHPERRRRIHPNLPVSWRQSRRSGLTPRSGSPR